jgi:hypothetical protein
VAESADLRRGLDEVLRNGAPAQRAAAAELLARWGEGTFDDEAARSLVDAFRHDPYL